MLLSSGECFMQSFQRTAKGKDNTSSRFRGNGPLRASQNHPVRTPAYVSRLITDRNPYSPLCSAPEKVERTTSPPGQYRSFEQRVEICRDPRTFARCSKDRFWPILLKNCSKHGQRGFVGDHKPSTERVALNSGRSMRSNSLCRHSSWRKPSFSTE